MSAADPQEVPKKPNGGPKPARTDRRSDLRLDCPPLRLTGLRATVYDVSRNGLCVHALVPVEHGQHYHLLLRDDLDSSTCEIDAEVVWHTEGRAGLRWVGLTNEQDRWLLRRFQAWLGALHGASRR